MFDRNTAHVFVDNTTQISIKSSPNIEQLFYNIYEQTYDGTIESGASGASQFFQKLCQTTSAYSDIAKGARNSLPLSAMFAEHLVGSIIRSKSSSELAKCINEAQDLLEEAKTNDKLLLALQSLEQDENKLLDKNEEALEVFTGLGYSESGAGVDRQIGVDSFLAVKNNSVLKYIAMLCGQMKRIYSSIKRTTPGTNPEIPDTYEFSNDLSRIMPDYFAQLDNEDCTALEDLFFLNFVESALVSQKFISKEEKGGGDIRLFLDYSGSMDAYSGVGNPDGNLNTRLNWAFGVASALFYMIKAENKGNKPRKFETTMFASDSFTKDTTPLSTEEYIKYLLGFNKGSGTNPNPGLLSFASAQLKKEDNAKSDIILVTDGNFDVYPEVAEKLQEARRTKNLHVFCIYIGTSKNEFLESISDSSIEIRTMISEDGKDLNKKVVKQLLLSSRGV